MKFVRLPVSCARRGTAEATRIDLASGRGELLQAINLRDHGEA